MPGAGELRVLRRRIKSVKSTQKITRSFELIAASKINKARRAVESARPYATLVTRVIKDLATESEAVEHPLLAPHDSIDRVAVIVISGDRGLAGAYNTNVLRRGERLMASEVKDGREVELVAVGKKTTGYFSFRGVTPVASYSGFSGEPGYEDARRIAEEVTEAYVEERVDRVWMVYTDFRSALTQVASTVRILPVDVKDLGGGEEFPSAFMFEPDPGEILAQLIPRYVEQRIFAGLLESAASEHASRQRAMKAATDNADDIIDDLTRESNSARQAMITTEISEIIGGAEALSQNA
jgi:F-type H+-transporting ATPase subunit gamma